ncbi:MAG: NAD(P)H-binding protein, partial [Chloroflexi bacterium]|nr:NAD(P)H-binding protein [Chloroflexota bacterium]
MILVIGGRSKIGAALIDLLLKRKEKVRALVRAGEQSTTVRQGVESVLGDLGAPASIHTAMRGVDGVFLLCGPTPDEVTFNRTAVDAARTEGVQFIVRSSIMGANPSSAATFIRDHGLCDEYLRNSAVQYAIVRPNTFMQSVVES